MIHIWTPDDKVVLPVWGEEISGFAKWVYWNGLSFTTRHDGFDFAAYITHEEEVVLGLPPNVYVRAIAEGTVMQVVESYGGYGSFINIQHGGEEGKFSGYHHVVPLVKFGAHVQKGEIIASLHKDDGSDAGRLVHLHLSLANSWSCDPREVDPTILFPSLNEVVADPQGKADFSLQVIVKNTKIRLFRPVCIANFKQLKL